MDKIEIPKFENKSELFKFLHENKDTLISQKKAIIKHSDAVISYAGAVMDKEVKTIKENSPVASIGNELEVRVVINTTNLMDSHKDVHLPGLWKKSLSENKSILHLQEHKMAFDKIISDGNDLKAFTQDYTWKQLGHNFNGTTQALVFDSKIRKTRNEFMLDQYGNGFVKQHSVGMRYVKIVLAMNSDEEYYGAEKEAWDKYYGEIANKEEADKYGYFWVVKEAKVIEGSAVPLGSNWITPTLDNNLKNEPSSITQEEEPTEVTPTENKGFFDNW